MTISDPELLMYVMEAREEVESTAPQDKARLQGLLDANRGLEERCLQVRGWVCVQASVSCGLGLGLQERAGMHGQASRRSHLAL